MWKYIKLIFVLSCTYEVQCHSLKVSLYYESLCPDCIRFVTKQLFPTYKDIGNDIKLDLIPFGKAKVVNENGKLEFICQHGSSECYGNEIQSCAIALYSVEESTEFIYCAMKSDDPSSDYYLETCANSTGISWASLVKCHTSGQGVELLFENANRTENLQPSLEFVPTVVFDDSFDQTLDDEAIEDLEAVVCKLLRYKPDACKSYFNDEVVLQMIH
ncbi:hypothetical protein NQ318_019228 [Aromia moschata]|uniref:Gamma-interferon-inducible lysosomal thiol reductase n=1 Tax=Aromia moschata TaxID=1265417 RepID=A0AAV8YYU6_9CUCU|nr:hypothetical protein NQ318_019228 [Aromia moschata]